MTAWNEVIGRAIAFEAARVTEFAAAAAAKLVGRGDEKAADQAAVDAMRKALNEVEMKGRIVIGEGERDEAPMLYIGEEVGTGKGLPIDIALDPLEGTTLTAKAMPNALAVLAFAPRGGLLHAPDVYMDKIAVGPGLPKGIVSLDRSPGENARAVAEAKKLPIEDLTVCVLDRPRHAKIIADLRAVGARIHLISDGDVAGVINTTDATTGIDLYIGQGGAPEGVLAAAALRCVGGQMQGRLFFRNEEEKGRAERIGVDDLDKIYDLNELASGSWIVFAATGVTRGFMLDGVEEVDSARVTQTILMTSWDGAVRTIETQVPMGA
jgi:fructose-1,6-bisphosphatase II / sedoheptulose-1,7-bisphosphatase